MKATEDKCCEFCFHWSGLRMGPSLKGDCWRNEPRLTIYDQQGNVKHVYPQTEGRWVCSKFSAD